MDILIRDVDPMFIKEIDKKCVEISNRLGRKFKRPEYIKMLIQNDCELRLIEFKEHKFDEAVNNLSLVLGNQVQTLQEFIDSNNRLFHLIASGENIFEGEDGNG